VNFEAAWKNIAESLQKDGYYYRSPLKETPDALWSFAKLKISSNDEILIQWFNSKIPAFDGQSPIEIISVKGEAELKKYLLTIPY